MIQFKCDWHFLGDPLSAGTHATLGTYENVEQSLCKCFTACEFNIHPSAWSTRSGEGIRRYSDAGQDRRRSWVSSGAECTAVIEIDFRAGKFLENTQWKKK